LVGLLGGQMDFHITWQRLRRPTAAAERRPAD
jgi:hypothetical protein